MYSINSQRSRFLISPLFLRDIFDCARDRVIILLLLLFFARTNARAAIYHPYIIYLYIDALKILYTYIYMYYNLLHACTGFCSNLHAICFVYYYYYAFFSVIILNSNIIHAKCRYVF